MAGSSPLRVIDLFAGGGGMTRGFVDAEFAPIMAVEDNLHAAATYAANFGEDHIFAGRIEDFVDVPEAEVVIGGPPCQGFSNLGKRDAGDHRNRLFSEFLDVADAANAKVFVFENVARFRRTPQCQSLLELARELEFEPQEYTLNAADFGTPQRRSRTIIIGSRIGPVPDPVETHHRSPTDATRRPWRTLEDVIGELAWYPTTTSLAERLMPFEDAQIPGAFSLDELHIGRNYQDLSIQRYDAIPPGGNRFDIPEHLQYECWRKHKSGSSDVMGRLEWTKPALTVRTEFFKPEKGRYLHPQWEEKGPRVNRALTHAEAALLQGFDERHVWCGTKVEIAKQIGNAVPPPLAHAVAVVVRHALAATGVKALAA